MRQLLLAAVTMAALSLPLAAQRGGSANRSSPKVGQSIEFTGGASVEIKYRALTWAGGQFMERLKTDRGREQTNADLKANPTGTLTCSADVSLGGQAVKAGTYKLYFEVDAQTAFHLVLANDAGAETKWKLNLAEGNDVNTRPARPPDTTTVSDDRSRSEPTARDASHRAARTIGGESHPRKMRSTGAILAPVSCNH